MKGGGSGQKTAWTYTEMALTVEHNVMLRARDWNSTSAEGEVEQREDTTLNKQK